jgi:hypothetical protein
MGGFGIMHMGFLSCKTLQVVNKRISNTRYLYFGTAVHHPVPQEVEDMLTRSRDTSRSSDYSSNNLS